MKKEAGFEGTKMEIVAEMEGVENMEEEELRGGIPFGWMRDRQPE